MSKLIIVSNRLPVAARVSGGHVEAVPTAGGLATGLDPVRRAHPSRWIGWPGDTARWSERSRARLDELLVADGLTPVHLSRKEVRGFYTTFSNGILWPLYHYLPAHLPVEMDGWTEYAAVNERFAAAVEAAYEPGDVVWVHDFHLSLLPRLVRERLPKARIGFFLHIPFPSSEVFRILPCREALLEGMLGADLVGFHTSSYANNFSSAVLRVLGLEARAGTIRTADGRSVQYGAFPLGVDVARFEAPGRASDVADSLAALHVAHPEIKVLLAVDRLDYTKGIPRRLRAFERLLESEPSLRRRVLLIQIAVPSRSEVVAYEENKRHVDEIVGRINGRFGDPGFQPIHYVSRGFSQEELVSLYRGADAMLVTPLRDGMNLVAKEFCASRVDGDGVLVLSEFAGAAAEMGEALVVNPYDIDGTARAMAAAITMAEGERRQRMRALRARIRLLDHARWSTEILGRLAAGEVREDEDAKPERVDPAHLAALCAGRPVVLLLDYDGTIFPIVRVPELAAPDTALRGLLSLLCARPDVYLAIVSGRGQETLAQWFGDLDAHLFAEHGAWERPPGQAWTGRAAGPDTHGWLGRVREMLRAATVQTPGSFVEEKSSSLVWHYRMAEPEIAAATARELHFQLVDALANAPLFVSAGKKIVEVRAVGATKGDAAVAIRRRVGDEAGVFVALGDDLTDEDMFGALPDGGLSVRVGDRTGSARFALRDVKDARRFLGLLAARPVDDP